MICSLGIMSRKKIRDLIDANPDISVQELSDRINARPSSVKSYLKEMKLAKSVEQAKAKKFKRNHADFAFESWELNETKAFLITGSIITIQGHLYERLKTLGIKPKLKWKYTTSHLFITRVK